MTIFEMLEQSAILTVLGMAVVFTFLWIMIICVNLLSKLIILKEKNGNTGQVKNNESKTTVPPEHVSAISAAIAEYRKEGE